ncbi:hypothetical protein CP967_00400 [Streptomyces nitrosporeus]|uniref:Uncharacterized protein n=1 Tax=Streptomyces nitrosporeus TaxID=28894 RepID=A0A5J6F3U5_9ACTN|nr:hypothetical protein CP967_00400 [Streptomyces nitrosporeus]
MILVENPSTRSFVVSYSPHRPTPQPHRQVEKGSVRIACCRAVMPFTSCLLRLRKRKGASERRGGIRYMSAG